MFLSMILPALAPLWIAVVLPLQDTVQVLVPDRAIEAAVTDDDVPVETGFLLANQRVPTLGRSFLIDVDSSGTYTIDLRSLQFDSYLVLRDANGQVLLEDDDGINGGDARLVAELEFGTEYFVEACALHGQRGEFELLMRRGNMKTASPQESFERELIDARRRVSSSKARYGEDHPIHATSLSVLQNVLYAGGRYEECIPLLKHILRIRETALGPEHYETIAINLNLGSTLLTIGQYELSQKFYEQAISNGIGSLGEESSYVLMGRRGLARLHQLLGEFEASRTLLEQNLAIRERVVGPSHPEVGKTLNFLGASLRDLGEYEQAAVVHERALSLFLAAYGENHPETASSLNNLGLVFLETREFEQAEAYFERSLASFERMLGATHPQTAYALLNLGLVRQELGDLESALNLGTRALAVWEQSPGPESREAGQANLNLGGVLEGLGHYTEAREKYDLALRIFVARLGPDHPQTAIALLDRAYLMWDLGSLEQALRAGESALDACESAWGPDHPNTAAALHNIGAMLLAQGRPEESVPRLEAALEIYRKAVGEDSLYIATTLMSLGTAHRLLNQLETSREELARALELRERILGSDHWLTAQVRSTLTLTLLQLGRTQEALDAAIAVHESLARTFGEADPFVAESLHLLAEVHAFRGEYELAWDFARSATEGLNFRVDAVLDALTEGERVNTLHSRRRWLDLQSILASKLGDQSTLAIAFGELLVWKGRVTRGLKRELASLREEQPIQIRELVKQVASTQSQLLALIFDEAPRDVERSAARIAELRNRRRALELELHQALPEPESGSVSVSVSVSVAELARVLPSRSAVVCYIANEQLPKSGADFGGLRGEKVLSAWVLRSDGQVFVRDLGTLSEVTVAVHDFLAALVRERQPAGSDRGVRVLESSVNFGLANNVVRKILWDPVASLLEDVELVFVSPDGAMSGVPMGVLRQGERFLIEDFSFVVLQDPSELTRLPERDRSAALSLLCVGDVDFGELESGSSGFSSDWVSLPGTGRETELVLALHSQYASGVRRKKLAGKKAHEATLKKVLQEFDLLHIATHGFFRAKLPPGLGEEREVTVRTASTRMPLRSEAELLLLLHPGLLSGLVCSGANGSSLDSSEDGYLTAEEVAWLDLESVDLVVLSACETGLGQVQMGEGMTSLRRAFRVAGSSTVISSLWSVPDDSTSELMRSFYTNLWSNGLSKLEALRRAQLTALAANRAEFNEARPHTWGAFVLNGDWR